MFTEKQICLFWSNVRTGNKDECWNWKLSVDRYGYGKVKIGQTAYISHRVAYEICNGEIPQGRHVLHSCDNPLCCNPHHLRCGTHGDNMKDMSSRNEHIHEPRHVTKLNQEAANAIRNDFRAGMAKRALARKYSVSPRHIRGIVRGEYWKTPSSPSAKDVK